MKLAALFVALTVSVTLHATEISVARYGAKGDGVTMNTVAIQHAIDEAVKHHEAVTFPAGVYLTGSIFVKNGVTLRIDKGVTLLGSQNIKDYPEMPTRVAGIELTWPAALVNVYKQSNVSITGDGLIDGDGKVFWDSYWSLRKVMEPNGLRWASDYDAKRPRLIQIFDSSNVKLGGGLQLHRSGFWTVHICYSHDVVVDGVTIENNIGGRGPSTDGIDIDSSHNIDVSHADISVNDDALCLKAGRDADGLRVNRPTTDVKIHDSIIRDGASGITFGSETSGGFENIEAWNITTMGHVPNGILFKSAHTRGGYARHIRLHDFHIADARIVLNITMNWNPSYSYATIPAGLKNYPPYYDVLTTHVPPEKGIAHVDDVHIWNITATNAQAAFSVDAYKDAPLQQFTFDRIDIQAATAGHITDAKSWHFDHTTIATVDQSKVALADSEDVTGIPIEEAKHYTAADPSKKSSTEQDKY